MRAFPQKSNITCYYIRIRDGMDRGVIAHKLLEKGYKLIWGYELSLYTNSDRDLIIAWQTGCHAGIIDMADLPWFDGDTCERREVNSIEQIPDFIS